MHSLKIHIFQTICNDCVGRRKTKAPVKEAFNKGSTDPILESKIRSSPSAEEQTA